MIDNLKAVFVVLAGISFAIGFGFHDHQGEAWWNVAVIPAGAVTLYWFLRGFASVMSRGRA